MKRSRRRQGRGGRERNRHAGGIALVGERHRLRKIDDHARFAGKRLSHANGGYRSIFAGNLPEPGSQLRSGKIQDQARRRIQARGLVAKVSGAADANGGQLPRAIHGHIRDRRRLRSCAHGRLRDALRIRRQSRERRGTRQQQATEPEGRRFNLHCCSPGLG